MRPTNRVNAMREPGFEDRRDVGERAVPTLLQCLLRDSEPDWTIARQQPVGLVHLLKIITRARLQIRFLDLCNLHKVPLQAPLEIAVPMDWHRDCGRDTRFF